MYFPKCEYHQDGGIALGLAGEWLACPDKVWLFCQDQLALAGDLQQIIAPIVLDEQPRLSGK